MAGAASRMFGFLKRYVSGNVDDIDVKEVDKFINGLKNNKFAFTEELKNILLLNGLNLEKLIQDKEYKSIIEYVLKPAGLGYAEKPKALISFHYRDRKAVTALEEHILQSLIWGNSELHITISQQYETLFKKAITEIKLQNPELNKVIVTMSFQSLSTDSPAIYADTGEIVTKDGHIILFPAGTGSNLLNIENLKRPVFIRNVDNVPGYKKAQDLNTKYHKAMAVLLSDIKSIIKDFFNIIDTENITEKLLDDYFNKLNNMGLNIILAETKFNTSDFNYKKILLKEALNRPVCISAFVENTHEDIGGIPLKTNYYGKSSVTIVEPNELSDKDKKYLKSSSLFNPADVLADPTDHNGKPFKLEKFSDDSRFLVVEKEYGSMKILRIERPNLIGGAMAGWNSVFVKLPRETFAPAKTINDLLKSYHSVNV